MITTCEKRDREQWECVCPSCDVKMVMCYCDELHGGCAIHMHKNCHFYKDFVAWNNRMNIEKECPDMFIRLQQYVTSLGFPGSALALKHGRRYKG